MAPTYNGGAVMSQAGKISLELEIVEVLRLIEEYQAKIAKGTSSADNFISITDMEEALGTLRAGTNNIYTDIQSKMINQVDQKELLQKKKRNTDLKK